MRKGLLILPTVIGLIIVSMGQVQQRPGWIATGLVGLFLYTFLVIVIDNLRRTIRGEKNQDLLAKLVAGYFWGLFVAVIGLSIYLMGHN